MSETQDPGPPAAEDQEAEKPKRGWGIVLLEVGIVGAILFVMAAIATPKFASARPRANLRACLANQKTLDGALEMYWRDGGETSADLQALFPRLVSGGYLMQAPTDPGQGRGSSSNYSLRPTAPARCADHPEGSVELCVQCFAAAAPEVVCATHGTVRDPRE